jgi:hypothetical protein
VAERWLTPVQYARLTGQGASTVRLACRTGLIPGAELVEDAGAPRGKRWRIPAPKEEGK